MSTDKTTMLRDSAEQFKWMKKPLEKWKKAKKFRVTLTENEDGTSIINIKPMYK